MIYEGSEGSVNGYFKKKLIVSRPLGNGRTLDSYKKEALRVLIEALRDGNTLPNIKKLSLSTLKNFRYEETIKEPTAEDRDFVLFTLLILIKLGVVEEEGEREGLLVCGKKKPKRVNGNPVRQY
ncbi:MAG: hypothetical protein ACXAAH_16220 [Promethearchaeota archaeon]|jgi:hypothetical protein